jgi:hypothetical protein
MKLPQILGLPAAFLLVLCLPFAAVAFIRKKYSPARGDFLVALSWFLACYFFLTVIALKETRHGLLLVVPIVVFVGFALNGIIRERPFHYLQYLLPVAGAVLLAWTLREAPTPVVTGYHEAAEAVGELAPCNGRVLFVGNRDGAFIFNIRALPDRSDIQVVRADKLFLDINVMPSLGLNAREFDPEQISDMLNRFGISLVVTVPRQWSEAPVMASLAEVLESDQFEEVRRFPVTGRAAAERELVLYRNRATLADPPEDFRSLVRVGGKSLDR